MQAITYSHYGQANVLQLVDVMQPVVGPKTVLVRNHVSSVNPIDWKIRSGHLKLLSGFKPPARCGSDFAGEIIQIGQDVVDFKVGDRVYGFVNPVKGGAFAQQLCVPVSQLARIPDGLNYMDVGVIPLAGLTAYTALQRIAAVTNNDRVIINGCSGGVGVMAIQIAKQLGAYVIGICSDKNRQLSLSLGADEIVDYKENQDFNGIEKVKVFFDVVSNQVPSKIKHLMLENSIYVNTFPTLQTMLCSPLANHFKKQKNYTVLVKPDGSALEGLNQWLVTGQLKAIIDQTYSLSDMVSAQQYSETGHVQGKLAITID